MTTLPGLIVNLTLAHAQFTQGLNQVNQQLGVLNKSVNLAKNALTGFLAGFGVQQLVALGRGALDAAGGMAELAQQAGVTGKQLQILQFAGAQAGVAQEQLVNALSQLNIRLSKAEEGTSTLHTMMQRYNISTKDVHGNTRQTSDVLGDFADVIQETADQTDRGRIAAELFGARMGSKLLPFLAQGSEGFEEFGQKLQEAGLLLGDDFLADADAASDALGALQLALQRGFQIGVIGEFRDSVSASVDAMIAAKEAGEALGQIVGGALRLIAATAETLVPLFKQLASEIDTISNAARALGDLAERFTGDAVAVELLNEDIGSLNEQIADLIGRRRELESTGVGSERATAEINNQIEVFKRQREELIETRNQLQFVDTAEKDLGGTIPGTTAAIEEQARALAALAAQSESAATELRKLSAIDVADVEASVASPGTLTRAQDEFATRERKHKETSENILRITEDFTQRANQVRHQANEEAARDAKQTAEKIAREAAQAAEEQRQFDEQKTRQHYERLGQIAEDTVKRGKQAAREAAQDDIRLREQLDKEAAEARAKAAEGQADLMLEPFRNAIQGIQSATTSLFEDILSGGIDSFEELAASIKQTFIRLAAELASLSLFRMLAGGGFMFGGAGAALANPAGATMQMGAHGMLTGGGVTSTAGAAAVAGPGLLMPGLLGGLGGSLLAPMLFGGGLGTTIGGGLGGAGGAIGGALLGSALFPGPGTLIGGLLGGLGGGLGGGFLGSLFGGGGSSGNEVSIGGGFGRAGAGGTGAAAKFVVEFDKQMSKLLNERQRELADQALRSAKSVSVKYDKELSEGDMARLAAGRVAPVAGALGFREKAFEGLGAEEALGQLQEALQLVRTIEDLTGAVTPFKRAILDLRASFAETEARAKELGISTRGMGAALREAEGELRAQRQLEKTSLQLQLQTMISAGKGGQELKLALLAIDLQFEAIKKSATELGISLDLVNEAETAARNEARQAARAVALQRQSDRTALTLQLRAMISAGNTGQELAVALMGVELQFEGLKATAKELGVSLDLVNRAETAARNAVRQAARDAARAEQEQRQADRRAEREHELARQRGQQQARAERARGLIAARISFRELTGQGFAADLLRLKEAFREGRQTAREFGHNVNQLNAAQREATRELYAQRQFERASLALQLKTMISAGNAGQELQLALLGIDLQFVSLKAAARELGVSMSLVNKAEAAAKKQARQAAADAKASARADALANRQSLLGSEFQNELAELNRVFKEARIEANQFGWSINRLNDAQTLATRALKARHQAEIEQLALSVVEPFLALSDPLRDFVDDLEQTLLSPVELFRRAQQDFRETARQAQAGDIDAISRLREEGAFFIEQAGRFGASPAQVEATQEVLHATEGVTQQVDISMREATRGIRDEVRLADRHNVDTLKELGAKLDDVVREIKKMRT